MTGAGEASWADFAEAIFAEAAARGGRRVEVEPHHDRRISDAGPAPGQFAARRRRSSRASTASRLPDWRASLRRLRRRVCSTQLKLGR